MTNSEFVQKLKDCATNYKSLYVMGSIGSPMNKTNKERYINGYKYNQQADRKKMIESASADTFGFDCICLVKSILWGWCGNKNAVYGGAKYKSNGVPDIGTEEMLNVCKDVSTNFSKIEVGEYLWMTGHCGVYIGNGLAVECTPKWENKVQITAVLNIGKKAGYNGRTWTKHGKMPYITYTPVKTDVEVTLNLLELGSKGEQVKTLQRLLTQMAFKCGGVDGDFGEMTKEAVKEFQRTKGINIDGRVGQQTWNRLLKG